MGDRLGIPGAVDILFWFSFLLLEILASILLICAEVSHTLVGHDRFQFFVFPLNSLRIILKAKLQHSSWQWAMSNKFKNKGRKLDMTSVQIKGGEGGEFLPTGLCLPPHWFEKIATFPPLVCVVCTNFPPLVCTFSPTGSRKLQLSHSMIRVFRTNFSPLVRVFLLTGS